MAIIPKCFCKLLWANIIKHFLLLACCAFNTQAWGAEEYCYSWREYSSNREYVAVRISPLPLEQQVANYAEIYEIDDLDERKKSEQEIIDIRSTYKQSGVYRVGKVPEFLWEFEQGGLLSSNGQRMVISGVVADQFNDFLVVRIVGPDGLVIDIYEQQIVGIVGDGLRILAGKDYSLVEDYMLHPSGNSLLVYTNHGDIVEIGLDDGKIVRSNSLGITLQILFGSPRFVVIALATISVVVTTIIVALRARRPSKGTA